jgi:group I intron endonuclease
MSSGIYKIENIQNGKLYVGSAVNIKKRWKEHEKLLRNNKHHSPHLQNSWNEYKEENFLFEVIEEVFEKGILIEREQYWLDYYQSYDEERGYNICIKAGNTLGFKFSEESKQMFRAAKQNSIIPDVNISVGRKRNRKGFSSCQ